MKQAAYCILIFFTFCTVPDQQKAERLVLEYMQNNLDDPSQYQSIEFSALKPDTAGEWSSYAYNRKHRLTLSNLRYTNDDLRNASSTERFLTILEQSNVFERKIDSAYTADSAAFFSSPDSVYALGMSHKYRALDDSGQLKIQERYFRFDKQLTRIINPY